MKSSSWVILFSSIFFATSFFSPATADEFVMQTGAKEPYTNSEQTGFLDRIAQEAFGALGHEALVQSMPPARALQNVVKGVADGDMQRISGLDDQYSELAIVPEPVSYYSFTGFTMEETDIEVTLDQLAGKSVAYLRGWKYYENNLPDGVEAVVVDEPSQLLTLLQRGRVEIALFSHWSGLYWADQMGLEIHPLKPAFHRLEMYMYLNNRHEDLAPDLAQALSTMKADGRYLSIFQETLGLLGGEAIGFDTPSNIVPPTPPNTSGTGS